MKKITIPKEFGYPTTKVWVNGDKYILETGKEIEVTEEVAEVIEAKIKIYENLFKPDDNEGGNEGGGESVQPDWSQNDSTAPDYVKNRTHYEHHNVTSHTNFSASDASKDYSKVWRGTDGSVCIHTYIGSSMYDARKGWTWNRNGVGNLRLFLYIDGTRIDIPLETITDQRLTLVDSTYNGLQIKVCAKQGVVFINGEQDNYGNFIYAIVYDWGIDTPLPEMRLDYGEYEVHKLDKKYLPDDVGGSSVSATILYADDTYLYHDDALTTKVSKSELQEIAKSGIFHIESSDGVTMHFPVCIEFAYDYGIVYMHQTEDWTWYTSEFSGGGGPA